MEEDDHLNDPAGTLRVGKLVLCFFPSTVKIVRTQAATSEVRGATVSNGD